MNRPIRWNCVSAWLCGALLLSVSAIAQQKTQSAQQQMRAYEVSREVSLQGTVVSFTENSSTAPLGPHVVIQTASGPVDVHLADARLLKANHFTLAAGDSVRVIGENVVHGTGSQFFARIIQKGSQTLAVRSTRGFPLRPAAKAGKSEAGVL
jgi:DNA/RNA endonuclease YhcR with UshA esterase domain